MEKTMTVFFAVIAIWAVGNVDSAAPTNAPAPAVDCMTLIVNMVDCLSFVSNGSTEKKPKGSCCSGLKTVLKTDADCICEAFKNSGQLGVTLNVSKAMTLPAACHLSAPSLSNCGLSLAGGPAAAPGVSPSPTAGGPTSTEGATAPTPSPGSSGCSAVAISVGYLLAAAAVAASIPSF